MMDEGYLLEHIKEQVWWVDGVSKLSRLGHSSPLCVLSS